MVFGQLDDLDKLLNQLQSSSSVSSPVSGFWSEFVRVGLGLLGGLVIFFLFWLLAMLVARFVRSFATARGLDEPLGALLARLVKSGVILVGVITALGTLGVNVTAMVAAVGLIGLAIGLAARDLISNAMAGLLILAYKPFALQDVIRVNELEGTVSFVDLRYTVLLAGDKTVFLPNSLVLTNAITIDKKSPPASS